MLFVLFSSATPKEFEERGTERNELVLTLNYFSLDVIF